MLIKLVRLSSKNNVHHHWLDCHFKVSVCISATLTEQGTCFHFTQSLRFMAAFIFSNVSSNLFSFHTLFSTCPQIDFTCLLVTLSITFCHFPLWVKALLGVGCDSGVLYAVALKSCWTGGNYLECTFYYYLEAGVFFPYVCASIWTH